MTWLAAWGDGIAAQADRHRARERLAGAQLWPNINWAIDEGGGAAYHLDVAFNSATGIGVPVSLGEQAALRLFLFARARARLSMAGRVGELSGSPVRETGTPTPFGLPPPIGVVGGG